jgi:hypothetical protein
MLLLVTVPRCTSVAAAGTRLLVLVGAAVVGVLVGVVVAEGGGVAVAEGA